MAFVCIEALNKKRQGLVQFTYFNTGMLWFFILGEFPSHCSLPLLAEMLKQHASL